jgi:hypothetical protein
MPYFLRKFFPFETYMRKKDWEFTNIISNFLLLYFAFIVATANKCCLDILYIKMNVCLFVCLFVCMYLIQIHISEPIGTKLCTRLPLCLEQTVGYVWVRNSWPLRPFGPFFFSGHKMAAGATVFRDILISVVPAGVRMTSPTWRCRWRRSNPRQTYIRDSSGSSPNVAEMT